MLQLLMFVFIVRLSSWLEYNSLFVVPGGWGVRGSEQKILAVSRWMIMHMGSMFRV